MKHLSACLSYSKLVFNDIISIEIYGHGDVYFYNMLNMYDNSVIIGEKKILSIKSMIKTLKF